MDERTQRAWAHRIMAMLVLGLQVVLTIVHARDYERAVTVHDVDDWLVSMTVQGVSYVAAALMLTSTFRRERWPLAGAVVAFVLAMAIEGVRGAVTCTFAPIGLAFSGIPNLLLGWILITSRGRMPLVLRILLAPGACLAFVAFVWSRMCI